ncbi:MAG: hypothetical protein M3R00_06750, partial [Pseudomonadota bacterium]|nr:hypothetical protein [Pseudomonadota bacterium]
MKTNAERLRESLGVFEKAATRLRDAQRSGVTEGYNALINTLTEKVDHHIEACRKTLSEVNTGDDNNNKRLGELIQMNKNSLKENLSAYKKKLNVSLDPTGEESLERLQQQAKLLEQFIAELSQKSFTPAGVANTATSMANDAASAIGNVLPTSISSFLSSTAGAAGLRRSTDSKTVLKEICDTLVRDCKTPLIGNVSAKTR